VTNKIFVNEFVDRKEDYLYILPMTIERGEWMDITELIGKRIIQARERLGWNQSELARQIKKPRQHLSQIEQGRQQPRAELLIELAEVLGVSVDYLLGREDEDSERLAPAVA
jgi:ribosome-binding protein aMBF1 (putative translation factor)